MSTLLSFAMCALILAFYEYGLITYEDGNLDVGPTVDADVDLVIKVLGYIQLVTSISLMIGWLINKASLIIKAGWREYIDDNGIKYQNVINSRDPNDINGGFTQVKASDLSLLDARMLMLT